jgi:hypothetical protein
MKNKKKRKKKFWKKLKILFWKTEFKGVGICWATFSQPQRPLSEQLASSSQPLRDALPNLASISDRSRRWRYTWRRARDKLATVMLHVTKRDQLLIFSLLNANWVLQPGRWRCRWWGASMRAKILLMFNLSRGTRFRSSFWSWKQVANIVENELVRMQ